ncbi:MAG TPA: nucleotide exchange factor GrpE [Dehalococcoidia bacterium]|jgi:molecular chaperone GrpE|nr:nucleotide exchange factor GrpE [Dehalococcoidia bacterium]
MEEDRQEATAELGAPDAQRYLDNWRRAEADFENYKKRIELERAETARFASTTLVLNILPVLDDLDRAFKSIPEKLAHLTWADGIRLIHRKLQATLEAQGVTEIKALGETFDPSIHEAVGQTAGEEGKVIEEAQKGYRLHGRVIRPAFVIVGNGQRPERNETESATDSHDSGG